MPIVAIIAQGAMGAGLGRRLVENGADVVTCLEGRSESSRARAREAGLRDVPLCEIAEADFFLSVLPPGDAASLAERLLPVLTASARKPIFVDCNAVNVPTVERIAAIVAPSGCAFVDGAIIGAPPKPGSKSPVIHVSGPQAERVVELARFGLDVRTTPGGIGAASALKMSYAGITKGITGLAAIMLLAAERAGTSGALYSELAESQPEFLAWFQRQVPSMFPKAYRWVAEMEEIAAFLGDDPAGASIFEAQARFYERLAADLEGPNEETTAIASALKPPV
jgi:putative dehydrogenase